MSSRTSLTIRLYQLGALFTAAATSCIVLGVGCSDKRTTGKTQANTQNTDILPDAGPGWSDASVPANVTSTEACTRFMRAACERKNECGLGGDDCAKAVARCPDSMFSKGSTSDPVKTWECALTMRQRSCSDVYKGIYPECFSAGTVQAGGSCIASSQCASLLCAAGSTSCGSCVARVGKGASCSDVRAVACDQGLTCDSGTKTCVDLPEKTFDGVVSTGLELGKPCDGTHTCANELYCEYGDAGTGACAARVPEGGTCSKSPACAAGLFCSKDTLTCYPMPPPGSKCGVDLEYFMPIYCSDDAYCDTSVGVSGMCKALPTAGEPCASAGEGLGPTRCAPSAYCDGTADPPVCVELAGPAASCTEDSACVMGLRCLCSNQECAEKSCGVLRDVGESCAEPGEICNAVSTCTDGLCKANDSQGIYDNLCGAG